MSEEDRDRIIPGSVWLPIGPGKPKMFLRWHKRMPNIAIMAYVRGPNLISKTTTTYHWEVLLQSHRQGAQPSRAAI